MGLLAEFIDFLRFKICVFGAAIGAFGYLLARPIGPDFLLIVLSSFFAFASTYMLNLVADVKEDKVNRGGVNFFSRHLSGRFFGFFFLGLGCALAVVAGKLEALFYLLFATLNLSYSFLRLKKLFPLKNVFIGTGLASIFLMGAGAAWLAFLPHYLVLATFIGGISLMADLRDYEGDKRAGVGTIPVRWGKAAAKAIVYAAYASTAMWAVIASAWQFYVVIPFVAAAALVYEAGYAPKVSHHYAMVAVMMLPLMLLLEALL